jgi:hypothetical protein
MTNEQEISKLAELIRTSQLKYIYYVIALNVAGVAFTVQQTIDSSLAMIHIPLAISIICWGAGIIFGFLYINRHENGLFINFNLLQLNMLNTKTPNIEKELLEKLKEVTKKSKQFYKAALYLFYVGSVFFVAYHILNMAFCNHYH